MTPAPATRWWDRIQQSLEDTAVAVGASSRSGRQHWSTGNLSGSPVTPTSTFYGASVTKQLVAALVARDVLDGHLDARTSIRSYLPGLPEWAGPIAVHHLVHHTAALPQPRRLAIASGHPDDAHGWSRLDNHSVMLALHEVPPPVVRPGQVFSYDNTGYVLLAELLRAVHGSDAAELTRTRIVGPLGLARTRLGGPAPVLRPGHPAPPATVGDGGLWTSVADLVAWLEAMNEGRLGTDLSALVQKAGRLDDGTVLDYAWGVGPRPGPAGTVYLHGGEWPGWCAMTIRCPAAATAVAVLAGTEDMATVSGAAVELHDLLTTSR